MIENLQKKYDEFQNIIDVLPTNNKENRNKKTAYIVEEEIRTNALIKETKEEIDERFNRLEGLTINPKIAELEAELEKCNIVNEWNSYNTPYEKMHLDYYLFHLSRYYKDDLASVNSCIKMIVESFKKVGIELQKDDFNFHPTVVDYMSLVLSGANEEELKNKFEGLYWTFPEMIQTIVVNFKSIYLKYEKEITRYYELRHQEFLKSHQDSEIDDMRINLVHEIGNLKNRDGNIIVNKFKNKEFQLPDFNDKDIDKKKETYFSENNFNYSNLERLNQILFEYELLLKYDYLLKSIRELLQTKDTLKNSKANALKEISKLTKEIDKLNAKQKPKFLFFKKKKKNDEKWLFQFKTALTDIMTKYDEFDDACFNDLIFNRLSQDSSIYEVLKFISSNYLYFVRKVKEHDETDDIQLITNKYEELKDDVNNNHFSLLNNIALLDEKQMKEIIVNRYNLEGINLTIDSLQRENIEKTRKDIISLMNYENVLASGLKIDDIKFYMEVMNTINKSEEVEG